MITGWNRCWIGIIINAVVAGNRYLANRAIKAGAKEVVIIPTVIDLERYKIETSERDGSPVIGWVGSPSTQKYVVEISSSLEAVCQKFGAKLLLVGANKNVSKFFSNIDIYSDIFPAFWVQGNVYLLSNNEQFLLETISLWKATTHKKLSRLKSVKHPHHPHLHLKSSFHIYYNQDKWLIGWLQRLSSFSQRLYTGKISQGKFKNAFMNIGKVIIHAKKLKL